MALDYSTLLTTVQNYDPEISSNPSIPFETLLLELDAELQPIIKSFRTETTVTITSAGNTVTLPSDFLEARNINIDGLVLKPMSAYGGTRYEGEIGYVMKGATIQLLRDETSNVDVELTYFARFPALTLAAPTNWVLEFHPGVYIHGLLSKVFRWLQNPNQEGPAKANLQAALSGINAEYGRYMSGGNQIQMGDVTSW